MTVRDILLNLLISLGFVGFVVAVSVLETIPFWIAVVVAAVLWLIYIVIVIRDHQRDIRYPLIRVGPQPRPKTPQPIYDQKDQDNQ